MRPSMMMGVSVRALRSLPMGRGQVLVLQDRGDGVEGETRRGRLLLVHHDVDLPLASAAHFEVPHPFHALQDRLDGLLYELPRLVKRGAAARTVAMKNGR